MSDERIAYSDLMERWRTAKARVRTLLTDRKALVRYVRAHEYISKHEPNIDDDIWNEFREAYDDFSQELKDEIENPENLTTPAK